MHCCRKMLRSRSFAAFLGGKDFFSIFVFPSMRACKKICSGEEARSFSYKCPHIPITSHTIKESSEEVTN